MAVTNSLNPKYPCRFESAIAQTFRQNMKDHISFTCGIVEKGKRCNHRIQHILHIMIGVKLFTHRVTTHNIQRKIDSGSIYSMQ